MFIDGFVLCLGDCVVDFSVLFLVFVCLFVCLFVCVCVCVCVKNIHSLNLSLPSPRICDSNTPAVVSQGVTLGVYYKRAAINSPGSYIVKCVPTTTTNLY